ncbi:MAG: hypothetical protein WDW36_008563 [Sanguina aurantia]
MDTAHAQLYSYKQDAASAESSSSVDFSTASKDVSPPSALCPPEKSLFRAGDTSQEIDQLQSWARVFCPSPASLPSCPTPGSSSLSSSRGPPLTSSSTYRASPAQLLPSSLSYAQSMCAIIAPVCPLPTTSQTQQTKQRYTDASAAALRSRPTSLSHTAHATGHLVQPSLLPLALVTVNLSSAAPLLLVDDEAWKRRQDEQLDDAGRVLEPAQLSEVYTSCAHAALQSFSLQAGRSHGLSASAVANLLVPYTPWGDGIGRHVGSGGKGAVFKCTLGDGRQVAVKRMVLKDVEMVWEFVTEGCFSAELFAAGAGLEVHSMSLHMDDNGREVHGEIVMQLADMDLRQEQVLMVEQDRAQQMVWAAMGETRAEYEQRKVQQQICNVGLKLSRVVELADHLVILRQHGILHQDIKGANIVVRDGAACFIDLGMAQRLAPGQTDMPVRGGTTGYQPVEAMSFGLEGGATRRASHAIDTFSFGMTIVELVLVNDCLAVMAVLCPALPTLLCSIFAPHPEQRPDTELIAYALGQSLTQARVAATAPEYCLPLITRLKSGEDKESDAYGRLLLLRDLQRYVNMRRALVAEVEDPNFLEDFDAEEAREVWQAVGCEAELVPYLQSLAWSRVQDRAAAYELVHGVREAMS